MSLWVDKYRPNKLNKLDFGLKQAAYLETLVKSEDFPHLLIHGPSGAGKKTRIVALLRELYGPGVERLRIEHQNFETPSKKKLEIMTIASNYHIELNPSDVGIYDRVVIQELIKNTASAQQIHGDSQRASFKTNHGKSRCLSIRIPAPSADDIIQILVTVSKKEGCLLPMELARRITEKSNRNLRRALLLTEACKVKQYPFVDGQDIVDLDWEVYLKDTARMIVSEQTPKKLLEVRGRLYELLGHCIPPDEIFVGLLKELVKNCDGELKTQLTSLAASYEHRLNQGNKSIFHLEAFVAKFMSLYMKFMEETMGCGF
ncbi:RFC3_5 [Lepeophtheirus salmonis]|uniref:Replication factor C subunit 3 n=1 Tax=Lepeophtheirus salmonis TaxID=72036 RepID=A0A7R8CPI4_LEPSM|nr:RFC3_5 [Lepeophtheirus salmonis]CAF2886786.1 RFC3_5 [Lepeophtheirus salmonis]